MEANEYQVLAEVTESKPSVDIINRLTDETNIRLLHAGMGLVTEAGEFMDMLKKHIFYGKKLDKVNLAEEIGDEMWYVALAMNALKKKLSDVMETNIDKLKARYGDKFTEAAALNRNLSKERAILEKGA